MNGEQFVRAILNAPAGTRAKIEMLLNGDESVAPAPIADARTCTQSEAARRLGISRQTVNRLIKAGTLPIVNLTGMPRVKLTTLDDFAKGKISAENNPIIARRMKERIAERVDAGRKGAAALHNKKGAAE